MNQLRVVTGVDDDGRSVVVERGAPSVVTPAPGFHLAEQWACERVGEGALAAPPTAPDKFLPEPPPGGVLFRLVTFPSDPDGHMHATGTVDLVTVISGELVLALEGGDEVTVGPGDTVVQRGATHAWRNLSDEPAVAAVVMVSARDR